LFDSLAEGREKLGLEPLPKLTLMADNANAICNGFRESKCDSGIRGNCWFHVKKNVLKELACVKNLEKKADLLQGIHNLQLAQSPSVFKIASALFVQMWCHDDEATVVEFIQILQNKLVRQKFKLV
jgi:hypothetical protein